MGKKNDTPPVGKAERKAIAKDDEVIESHRSSADKAASARAAAPMTEADKRR